MGIAKTIAHTNAQLARAAEHTEAPAFSDAGKAALSRQLSNAVNRGDTPGVVALVVGRDSVLYEVAAGKLDVAHYIAMPVNAIFSIASMTKPVTSVAIMMLFEKGQLKLGMIVEKITAEPLEDYFQQRILAPLGMVDTSYAVPLAKQLRVATKHSRVNGLLQERPRSPISVTPTAPFPGDCCLYLTAQDYGKFMQMLLNGGHLGPTTILSESSGEDIKLR